MPVINRRKPEGLHEEVYIGRGSPWGNPYVLRPADAGEVILTLGGEWITQLCASREEAIAEYREALWLAIQAEYIDLADLAALNGRILGCYCKPKACHGDVLVKASAWAQKQLLAT